jgi:hypothetical protein
MSEWWTYTLSDFLMFAPRTYYRLFELYNLAIWPMQLLTLALGVALLALMQGRASWHGRAAAAILAACWLWVAIRFHLERYATINWAASYFAAAFALEALLLAWIGVVRGRLAFDRGQPIARWTGLGLVVFAVLAFPFVGMLAGRTWAQSEIFGVAPDPTAIATLGVLCAASGRSTWVLQIVPALWSAVSAATLFAMQSVDAPVPMVVLIVLLLLAAWRMSTPVHA